MANPKSKISLSMDISSGNCILYFCFYSLFEEKTKCENSDIGGIY